MKNSQLPDPFEEARTKQGVLQVNDQDESVTMILRLKDVRKCAHKWKSFSSGNTVPGRIVVPSEVNIRNIRQIPVETDPPNHKSYRALLDPWFKRPLDPTFQMELNGLIIELLEEALEKEEVEIVEGWALRLQSLALTLLLNVPREEAQTWVSWGTHVFRSEDSKLDNSKAAKLDEYILQKIEEARKQPTDDLYSILLNSTIDGKHLSTEEIHGIVNLTFAGGRDTVINAISNAIAYFAEHPDALEQLRAHPEWINTAVEELVRYFAPLTQLGRISVEDTQVCEHAIKTGERISLCWASANRDSSVFEQPNEIHLDRKINPHLSFGFGIHQCLGATHARQILRTLLAALTTKVKSIEILDAEENIERMDQYKRKVGFHKLSVKFHKI